MNAAFSYLSEIGAKNESDIKKERILQIVLKATQRRHWSVSLLWTHRGKAEKRQRRVETRGGGRGQLQCGQVCRVSRERERLRMKHYGIDLTLNTGWLSGWLRWDVDWPVWDRGCRPDLSQLAVSQEGGGGGGGGGGQTKPKEKPNVVKNKEQKHTKKEGRGLWRRKKRRKEKEESNLGIH